MAAGLSNKKKKVPPYMQLIETVKPAHNAKARSALLEQIQARVRKENPEPFLELDERKKALAAINTNRQETTDYIQGLEKTYHANLMEWIQSNTVEAFKRVQAALTPLKAARDTQTELIGHSNLAHVYTDDPGAVTALLDCLVPYQAALIEEREKFNKAEAGRLKAEGLEQAGENAALAPIINTLAQVEEAIASAESVSNPWNRYIQLLRF